VQDTGKPHALFDHDAERPRNPASVMKLVTTFAALDMLGPGYRWKTEAYLGGPLVDGELRGDLILKGYGDPKITIEQWQSFMAQLRSNGLAAVDGDLALDRSRFALPPHDPSAFDHEPLKPYNVGPDALLVNFKTVRFRFVPAADGASVAVIAEPPLPQLAVGAAPAPVDGPCGDWRTSVAATFIAQRAAGIDPWRSGIALTIGINLVITLAIPFISKGGHLGGLAGGALLAWLLIEAPRRTQNRQAPLIVAIALVPALFLAAVAAAYAFAGVPGL